jgi:hypothetical protein
MISDITDKLSTNKNTIKGLMRNIIDDSETRRIMVNVLDKTFNDILDGSLIIRVPKPDKDLIVSRSELAETTKAFTKLLNRFYQIEASEGTASLIDETKAKQSRMAGKEAIMESSLGGRSSSPEMPMGGGNTNDLLLQYLPKFTEKLNTLRDALGQLDLSGSGGGIASEVIDEAGDAVGGGTPRGRGGTDSRSGPSPRQGPGRSRGGMPGAMKFGLGAFALGGLMAAAPKAAEMASDAFSAGTNFLSNTISTVAKKAESILASIGQAAGGLIDAGGAALGAGGGEYAAVGAGGRGAWASDAPFIQAVNDLAQKYNIDANDLIGLMQSESGVNPQARNPNGGATGLIQFMPNTARGIGTTTDALYAMNRAQQMVWVDRYFQANRLPRGATAGNLYASVFLPAYTSRPPNFVVARSGGPNDAGANRSGSWYSANRGLDLNNDGAITIAELGERVSKKRQEIGLGPSSTGGGFRAAVNTVTNAATNVGNAIAETASSATTAIGNAITGNGRMADLVGTALNLGGGRTGNRRNLQNLDPTFERQIFGAVSEYHRTTRRRVTMTSGFRYPGDQASIASSGRAYSPARPGRSRHERGLAMDFNSADTAAMERSGILRKYGLMGGRATSRSGGIINDPPHVQQLGGGTAGTRPPAQGQGQGDSAYYQMAGEDGLRPQQAYTAVRLTSLVDMVRTASAPSGTPPPQPAETARLPTVSEATTINRRLRETPRVVVVERPRTQPETPPMVTSLGDMQTPPKSNPDLATQYRVYFGVA